MVWYKSISPWLRGGSPSRLLSVFSGEESELSWGHRFPVAIWPYASFVPVTTHGYHDQFCTSHESSLFPFLRKGLGSPCMHGWPAAPK